MKPLAWSHSALDTFVNCPRQYQAKYVLKRFPYVETPEMAEGNRVHKAFELRVAENKELPFDLQHHEDYINVLATKKGKVFAERKIAFNKQGQPCSWEERENIWYRGVMDYSNVWANLALVVDYKTGKPHNKFKQLTSNALWIFANYPDVDIVSVRFYWTRTQTETGERYIREQVPELWGKLLPDLKQYKEAFTTDTWQPRQSGLCNGWCPVEDCEFWRPKRKF